MAHRTIIESEAYLSEKMAFHDDPRVVDDLLEGALFILARSPEAGHRIQGTPLWGIKLGRWLSVPPSTMFYHFDESSVTLVSIRRDSE